MTASIIEKSNKGLFENEIELNGKYATIIRHLRDDLGIFTTFREAYLTAAVIGFAYNKMGTDDNSEKVQPASIFPSELSRRKHDLKLLYSIFILVNDNPDYTIEDYMNRAFRYDADEGNTENLKENMAVFNSYVCGGLEYLQERFDGLDKTADVVDTLYELVHEFAVGVKLIEDDDLPDFTPTFE